MLRRHSLGRLPLVPALLALTPGLIVLPACGNNQTVTPPAAFDRPEDVAFYCRDTRVGALVPLDDCAPFDDEGQPPEGFALYGLVTQTTTGELAAVRITGESGVPGVIDTDVRVPGFTFAAVGEVPSAVVVDPDDPRRAYVTSRGSSELHSVDVETLETRARDGAAVTLFADMPRSSRPSAMVLAAGSLFVTLPERGSVAQVTLDADGRPLALTELTLAADVPDPVDLTTLAADEQPSEYLYTCPAGLVQTSTEPISPRTPARRGDVPEPWSFALDDADPAAPRLLVADRALPLIHVIDVATFTELDPISVGVPVRELALTPPVPTTVLGATPDAANPFDRYLYAIDELDRSVLVVDYDEGNPSFGAVLQANAVAPFDRLALAVGARDIEVVTPSYDPSALSACTDAAGGTGASGGILHGVFLAVATSGGALDGGVRFFDIYDLDTPCRGVTCGTAANLFADDQVVAIGRHRPRIRGTLETGVQVDPEPAWDTTSGSVAVQPNGTTSAPNLAPVLEEVTCEAPLGVVYPVDNEASRVCAVVDPWGATDQTWTVAYEGVLPFSSTTGANLVSPGDADRMVIETRSDACSLGVLGSEDAPAAGYLAGYAGDRFVITADLPPTVLMGDEDLRDRCEELVARTAGGDITPLELPILTAETRPADLRESYVSRLTVGAPTNVSGATVQDVFECYPELVEGEVQATGVFVVTSSIRPGFQHPVARADSGACEVDAGLVAAGQLGRARFGETYASAQISFALGAAPANLVAPVLTFAVRSVPVPLAVDVSSIGGTSRASLLASLEYNRVDERLYVIDQAVQGLLRLRLTNLTVEQTFR